MKDRLIAIVVSATTLACSDGKSISSEVSAVSHETMVASVGGFSCGVWYHAITHTDDAELAAFGVEPATDTAQVCEAWTGNDYQVEVTQIGSSEPPSDFSEDVKTVVYQNGATQVYDAAGSFIESQPDVGINSFEFVAATAEEQQASQSDPYYGVVQSNKNCAAPPTCTYLREESAAEAGTSQVLPGVPFERPVLRHVLNGMSEIAPSLEGHRRFRKVTADGDDITISVEPLRELVRRREIKNARGKLVADLNWSRVREKYVRDRMDVVSEEVINGRTFVSRTSVVLNDVKWDPALVK